MDIKNFVAGVIEGQKLFGETIAVVVNSVLLTMVYVFGAGLTSIIAKIFGKHFLDLRFEGKKTYWEDLNLGKKKMEEYFRQF